MHTVTHANHKCGFITRHRLASAGASQMCTGMVCVNIHMGARVRAYTDTYMHVYM
jgi:hypothetical protein